MTERIAFPAKLRAEILDAHCRYCGQLWPTEIDHIMPISRGGSNARDNLAPACLTCNHEKSDLTVAEWQTYRREQGWAWPPPSRDDVLLGLLRLLTLEQLYQFNDVRDAYPDKTVELFIDIQYQERRRSHPNPADHLGRLLHHLDTHA